jgi:hypothetical protein
MQGEQGGVHFSISRLSHDMTKGMRDHSMWGSNLSLEQHLAVGPFFKVLLQERICLAVLPTSLAVHLLHVM